MARDDTDRSGTAAVEIERPVERTVVSESAVAGRGCSRRRTSALRAESHHARGLALPTRGWLC